MVTKLPTILRSDLMDEFLGIRERIATIKQKIGTDAVMGMGGSASGFEGAGGEGLGSGSSSGAGGRRSGGSYPDEGGGDGGMGMGMGEGDGFSVDLSGLIMSTDEADEALSANPCHAFNEDELSQLEEDVRDLFHLLISLSPHDLLAGTKFRPLLVRCTKQWPRLRATVSKYILFHTTSFAPPPLKKTNVNTYVKYTHNNIPSYQLHIHHHMR